MKNVSPIRDADNKATLTLNEWQPGAPVAFTIDVNNTLRHSTPGQIRVTDSEIADATVAVISRGVQSDGVFNNTSRAVIRTTACTS